MKKILSIALALSLIIVALSGCAPKDSQEADGGFKVVTTTTIIADVVKNIAGDLVQVEALMGPGVDPHLYKASAEM